MAFLMFKVFSVDARGSASFFKGGGSVAISEVCSSHLSGRFRYLVCTVHTPVSPTSLVIKNVMHFQVN